MNDPHATFISDQAAAQKREEEQYALSIRNGEAQALAHEAHAAKLTAQKELLGAVSGAVALLSVVTALHGLKRLVTRR